MMFQFVLLIFANVGLHISSQHVFSPENLDSNKAFQETFFETGTLGNISNQTLVRLSPSKYVKVYAFSSKTGKNYSEIVYRNLISFKNSSFDIHKPTKILIHGWMANALGSGSYEEELRNTYLASQDVNVLSVDWSLMADNLFYTMAKAQVEPVGKFVAQFIDWLVSKAGVTLKSIHIIGHSLGAHISGVVGECVKVGKISRITGLDPAGPGFSNDSTSGRLDSSDAQFVDVIHTCAPFAGFYDACGHVDFYPNKGEPAQPGCGPPDMLICSHVRSHDLFNESIISTEFQAKQCSDWQGYANGSCNFSIVSTMGEHVDLRARGTFYLYTNKSYPYALGNIWI